MLIFTPFATMPRGGTSRRPVRVVYFKIVGSMKVEAWWGKKKFDLDVFILLNQYIEYICIKAGLK